MSRFLAALALFALPLSALPLSASAGDGFSQRVHLSANVPVECEMDLRPAFRRLGSSSFELGSVQRYCNTAYTLSASFNADASGGDFTYGGSTAPASAGTAVLAANGRPTRRPTTLRIHGVSEATARSVADSLTLSVRPTGL